MADFGQERLLAQMRELGVEITREAYIDFAWGNPLPEWDAEMEGELPEELQDWSLFEEIDGDLRLKKGAYPGG